MFPCAGSLPIDMQTEFGPIPAACLPLGDSIVLEKILRPNIGHYDKIFVAFSDDYPIACATAYDISPDIEVINVGFTGSIGETLFKVLSQVPEYISLLTVQMGDAYFANPGPFTDAICVKQDSMNNRWVSITLNSEKMIENFSLPGSKTKNVDLVFSGKFSIGNFDRFFRCLTESVFQSTSSQHYLYDAMKRYYNELDQLPLVCDDSWSDFGYSTSYYKFRQVSGFNERSFNNIEFSEKTKSVIKRSENKEKLINEIQWYLNLPNEIARVTPRIFSYDVSLDSPHIEMEYESGIPVDHMLLFARSHFRTWEKMVKNIGEIFQLFKSVKVPEELDLLTSSKNIYLKKTLSRIEKIKSAPFYQEFDRKNLRCNGERIPRISEALALIEKYITTSDFLARALPSVVHGDLCFSNMMYDPRLDKITIFDPRGSFGTSAHIFGDHRYDLAKLYHSSHGKYDFLVNGYFSLNVDGESYEFSIMADRHQNQVTELVSNFICNQISTHQEDLLFIEALLFLSMVPLHEDKPKNQKMLLLNGLRILKLWEETV